MLSGSVEQEISENLQPQPEGTIGGAMTEQKGHLFSVLVAEIPGIESEKPAIDSFGYLHGRHPSFDRRLVSRA